MEIIQCTTASDMGAVAKRLLSIIGAAPGETAAVVALRGDLGAGKTTLVQSLAALLGVTEAVTSPTYVIMKGYDLPSEGQAMGQRIFSKLLHIDAYRIEEIDEMRVLGFSELLQQNNTIICVEWPERIAPLIPDGAITVAIAIKGTERKITIS